MTDAGERLDEPEQAFVEATGQPTLVPTSDPTATTTADAGEAAVSVATSVGTMGYAMFALLRRGPLDSVPTFEEFLDRPEADDADITSDLPADPEVFGSADIDEHLSAVTRPAVTRLAVAGTIANGQALGDGHPVTAPTFVEPPEKLADVPQPAAATVSPVVEPVAVAAPADPEVAPVFAHPAPPVRTSSTLAMLQEISFLDE